MHAFLAKPDVVVTNAKDKEKMLPVVRTTAERVCEIYAACERREARERARAPLLRRVAEARAGLTEVLRALIITLPISRPHLAYISPDLA